MPKRKAKIMGDWREEAACIGKGNEMFYPERSHALAQKAKAICAKCPVKGECLDEAISNNEKFGIWGGMDTLERTKEIRRRRNRRVD